MLIIENIYSDNMKNHAYIMQALLVLLKLLREAEKKESPAQAGPHVPDGRQPPD